MSTPYAGLEVGSNGNDIYHLEPGEHVRIWSNPRQATVLTHYGIKDGMVRFYDTDCFDSFKTYGYMTELADKPEHFSVRKDDDGLCRIIVNFETMKVRRLIHDTNRGARTDTAEMREICDAIGWKDRF